MSLTTTTHANFRGDARAALEFYQATFGGELTTLTYEQMQAVGDPAEADQIMWGQVLAPNGFHVMAFDVPGSRAFDRGTESFFESLRTDTIEEATTAWEKLSEGATVIEPFGPVQWGPAYGMLTDKFGITWVIDVAVQY
ncbi:MAG: VOC family protein [Nakamurella sp.]